MKILMITAACVALAACDRAETPPAPAETTPAATPTADTASMAGTYEVTMEDGTVAMSTLFADGSYVDTTDGVESERGTWRADGERTCFDPAGDPPEECHATSTPAADGSFKVLDAEGQETGVTVRKVDASATPTAATTQPPA